jgi:hypothetical protein
MSNQDFTSYCVAEFQDPKEKETAKVVARELQAWARTKLPMGAGSAVTEKMIKMGLADVRFRLKQNPQAYGIDPVTLITVISALLSIASKLVNWWKGR